MLADIAETLRTHGIRPSVQRIGIYRYLTENKNHPTADMLYTALQPSMPTLSKTTVYNTLRLFEHHGLVQTVPIENDEVRYDADTEFHVHFKCTRCGGICDIYPQGGSEPLQLPEHFVCEKKQYFIWGMCRDCSRAEGAQPIPIFPEFQR